MAVHVIYIIEKTRRTPSGCNDDILEVGDFMKKVYDDGRLGIGRGDQFLRPAMMLRYDCDEEADSAGPDNSDEDDFFN